MPRQRRIPPVVDAPQRGWAIYLRTNSDESQKPELSRARQRLLIEKNVLECSDMPVIGEYVDVLTGKTPHREGYQRLLKEARAGKFSHVIVECADQKELLRQIVERVVVDDEGNVRFVLRSPFAYLCDLRDQLASPGNLRDTGKEKAAE